MSAAASPRGDKPDDAALVVAVLDGDRRAFDLLYARHVERVYALIGRILGPGADVEDATQDAFIRAFRALSEYRGDARFSTLYRMPCEPRSTTHAGAAMWRTPTSSRPRCRRRFRARIAASGGTSSRRCTRSWPSSSRPGALRCSCRCRGMSYAEAASSSTPPRMPEHQVMRVRAHLRRSLARPATRRSRSRDGLPRPCHPVGGSAPRAVRTCPPRPSDLAQAAMRAKIRLAVNSASNPAAPADAPARRAMRWVMPALAVVAAVAAAIAGAHRRSHDRPAEELPRAAEICARAARGSPGGPGTDRERGPEPGRTCPQAVVGADAGNSVRDRHRRDGQQSRRGAHARGKRHGLGDASQVRRRCSTASSRASRSSAAWCGSSRKPARPGPWWPGVPGRRATAMRPGPRRRATPPAPARRCDRHRGRSAPRSTARRRRTSPCHPPQP